MKLLLLCHQVLFFAVIALVASAPSKLKREDTGIIFQTGETYDDGSFYHT